MINQFCYLAVWVAVSLNPQTAISQNGNTHESKVGNRVLFTNTYYDNNGKLWIVDYGTATGWTIATIALVILVWCHIMVQWLRTTSYDYDLRNNLTKFSFIDANGTNNTVTYEYNRSNQPWYAVLESGLTHGYFYDSLERVSRVKLYTETPIETTYTYVPSAASPETLTTTLISTEVSNAFAYSYYYDANGNITAILNGTKQSDGSYTYSDSTGNTYTYDQYNQLITDLNKDNATSTHYQYDTNGNITKKIVNSWNVAGNFPMGNLTTDYYTYGDTLGWGDLLTQYNGQTITYDEIGNPINYRNGMTMSWQAGRQLESITQNGKTYNFTYAHDGLRTKKSITSGNTTVDVNYVYEGDKLIQMTYDDYILTFSYDANGIPVSFHVKNATLDNDYYYGTNSRGDIEVIYNADGTLHARYDYDAYGKILSVTAPDGTNITAPYAIANLNPLRYRGYVYDSETGLYYLQSRYYDPVTCRFINADAYASTGQDFSGYNMFSYCSNNSVNRVDPTGMLWKEIGDFFVNSWNGLSTWATNTFGAGSSLSHTSTMEYELISSPFNQVVTVKEGTEHSKTTQECGDSSKPVSVYAEANINSYELSSAGVKFNGQNNTVQINVSLDNTGISFYDTSNDSGSYFAVVLDLTQFKVGIEYGTICWDGNDTVKSYTNASVTGQFLIMLYGMVYGGGFQQAPNPQYSQ